jgi:hypothetical protein
MRSCRRQKAVADTQATAIALACRQLEDSLRVPSARGPPRAEPRYDLDDLQIAVEEDGVDRKTHERGVDGRCGTKQDTFTARQLAASEQAPHARERRVRQDTALAHSPSVLEADGDFHYQPMWMWSK